MTYIIKRDYFAVGRMMKLFLPMGGARYSDSSDKDRFLSFRTLLIIQQFHWSVSIWCRLVCITLQRKAIF